jgi:hypothetical protein
MRSVADTIRAFTEQFNFSIARAYSAQEPREF